MANIHILGICGTFMGGIAAIARQQGHQVSGSDQNVYPPMSTQLENMGITIHNGYDEEPLEEGVDQVVVGNVMTRGMPATEFLLQNSLSYQSGPQWLGEEVLRHKQVYAVAGTHGKTTTSSMLAWILEDNGVNPGFLIGGVCHHFDQSARTTSSDAFVIEADEYDSAFFDKRSKFVHYHSNVVILNNLEFDHADIFEDLNAIKKQFHHLVRTVPKNGLLVVNHDDANLRAVLEQGCWTPRVSFGLTPQADFWVEAIKNKPMHFAVKQGEQLVAEVAWSIPGQHNQLNALAAMLAAKNAGVSIQQSARSLEKFRSVKKRMELIGEVNGITIYDDFAHHPTAIATTLAGAKAAHPNRRLIAAIEPRSNSMRMGVHAAALPAAIQASDLCFVLKDDSMKWDVAMLQELQSQKTNMPKRINEMISSILSQCKKGDVIIFMSNGSFSGAQDQLLHKLSQAH